MYYKYKFDGKGEPKKIIREEGDSYIMSDGAHIKKGLFETLFTKYEGNINESVSMYPNNNNLRNTGLPVIHNAGMIDDDSPIDPDTFFKQGAVQMHSRIEYDKNNLDNPNYQNKIKQESRDLGSIVLDENARHKLYNNTIPNLNVQVGHSTDSVVNPNEYVSPYGSNVQNIKKSQLNPMAMDPMFSDAKIEGSVKTNNPGSVMPTVNSSTYQQDLYLQQQQNQQSFQNQQSVQNPLFKKMKRKHSHTFSIKYTKFIADPDFIKIMDSNMEDSLVELFAEEFTNEVMKDRATIKQMFIDELELVVYGKKKTKPKKIVTKKSKTVEIETEKETEVTIVESKKDLNIDPISGKRFAPVDPRYAHLNLPPVLEDDDDDGTTVTILNEGMSEELE
jgi:hypothetical protein